MACLWAALGRAEVQFVEVAAEAGIAFRHQNGAEGQKYPMETMGSGTAFFDYDGDGWLDLYFVNSAGPGALYRNANAGQFADATNEAGVANSGYGLGLCCGRLRFRRRLRLVHHRVRPQYPLPQRGHGPVH